MSNGKPLFFPDAEVYKDHGVTADFADMFGAAVVVVDEAETRADTSVRAEPPSPLAGGGEHLLVPIPPLDSLNVAELQKLCATASASSAGGVPSSSAGADQRKPSGRIAGASIGALKSLEDRAAALEAARMREEGALLNDLTGRLADAAAREVAANAHAVAPTSDNQSSTNARSFRTEADVAAATCPDDGRKEALLAIMRQYR